MLPKAGLTRCLRAAGSGTDSRLPRCRFTNDRRPRLLTFPSIVHPPLSRFTVFSSSPPLWSCPVARRPVPQWHRFASIGTCRAGEQHAAQLRLNSLPARSGHRNRQPAASVPLHQRPPTAALDLSVHRPSSSLPFHRLLVISSFVVLSGRPAAGTSVAPVRFDRTCRAGEQHAAQPRLNSLPARSGQRNRQPAASVALHQRPPTAALDLSVHRPSSSLPFHRLLVISSSVVLSGRPATGTSVTPVRFDRHLSGGRTTCCPTAAQLAACAQRAAEPTAGCLGGASPTTADRGS